MMVFYLVLKQNKKKIFYNYFIASSYGRAPRMDNSDE